MSHLPTKRVLAIRRAAARFANYYGPLPKTNEGSEEAMHEVARRMHVACSREGLKIILDPDKKEDQ